MNGANAYELTFKAKQYQVTAYSIYYIWALDMIQEAGWQACLPIFLQ
jgi:hypothetical protein